MIRIFNFFKREYKTLNRIEILEDNLLHNYKYLDSLSKNVRVAPVIKSNGYGHGIINIAKILDPLSPPFFCVDSLYEAYQLLNAGVKTPILITGYTNPENLKLKKIPFSYALYTLDLAEAINKYQPKAGVHIFIDTGMRREGITIEELPNFLEELKNFSNLKIEGVMSHLASSKGKNDKIFTNQINNFKKGLKILKHYKINAKWIHIAASEGFANSETRKIILKTSNLSRVGLALYNSTLELKTCLIQIKTLKKEEITGYDGTFKAKKDTLVGILPIGYNDGVDRRLSNKGFVSIGGKFCKILGKISMNITTIDLTEVRDPKVRQEVVVYSSNNNDLNSIENASKLCQTIPYDLLIHLAASTKRIIV